MENDIIKSMLEQIDSEKPKIKEYIDNSIPESLKPFLDDARHEMQLAITGKYSPENAALCKKYYSGFLVLLDVALPLLKLIETRIYDSSKDNIDIVIDASEKVGRMISPKEAFSVLRSLPNDQRTHILSIANNFLSLSSAIDADDENQFVRLCGETTSGTRELLRACGAIELIDSSKNVADSLANNIDQYSENDCKKVAKHLIQQITCNDTENLFAAILTNMDDEIEELFPLSIAQELLAMSLLALLQDDYHITDTENEFLLKYLYTDANLIFEQYVEPIYYECIIKVDGSLEKYIKDWIECDGEDCKAVRSARTYMEGKHTPKANSASNAGRKKGCWIKDGGINEEQEWSLRIENYVWGDLISKVSLLKFKTTGKNRQSDIKYTAAALIYCTHPLSIPWSGSDGSPRSSFGNTMKFVGITRQTLDPFITMIGKMDELDELISEDSMLNQIIFKEGGRYKNNSRSKLVESFKRRYGEEDENRSYILFENYGQLGNIQSWLREKFRSFR